MKKTLLLLTIISMASMPLNANKTEPNYTPYFEAIDNAEKHIKDIDAQIKNLNADLKKVDYKKHPKTVATLFQIDKQRSELKKDKVIAQKNVDKAFYKLDCAANGLCKRTIETGCKLYTPELGMAATVIATTAGLGYLGYDKYLKKTN